MTPEREAEIRGYDANVLGPHPDTRDAYIRDLIAALDEARDERDAMREMLRQYAIEHGGGAKYACLWCKVIHFLRTHETLYALKLRYKHADNCALAALIGEGEA